MPIVLGSCKQDRDILQRQKKLIRPYYNQTKNYWISVMVIHNRFVTSTRLNEYIRCAIIREIVDGTFDIVIKCYICYMTQMGPHNGTGTSRT